MTPGDPKTPGRRSQPSADLQPQRERNSDLPATDDDMEALQDRVIRELDELNAQIEAVIGDYVRPRFNVDDEVEFDTPGQDARRDAA